MPSVLLLGRFCPTETEAKEMLVVLCHYILGDSFCGSYNGNSEANEKERRKVK